MSLMQMAKVCKQLSSADHIIQQQYWYFRTFQENTCTPEYHTKSGGSVDEPRLLMQHGASHLRIIRRGFESR